ncbi:Zn-dependent hydrolase [Nonomuraea turkmeniaca]|uniref:Zn-dependent hydrolase n=1 Tax=Nonomuraea turkmeniaca TaxID=103838 RepID=A0A5S4FJH1_9ACTN|nr:Zn-dependent hydrolase [Nonomuraea turkmeniaca]TMR20765.1 Zn-dependent hydrolase [Nonomuraea turkmeniaca]
MEPTGRALPRPDAKRLGAMLDDLAELSDTDDGVTRLAYSTTERAAHDLFASWLRGLGLDVRVDAAGNTIAERPGSDASAPAIATGSHLDSVPHGGRFDGIAGVVAAVEVARLLVEHDVEHRHPFRFVAFAAEEGARFGQACLGSKAVAGLLTPADLHTYQDAGGVSVAAAMEAVGLEAGSIGKARWQPQDWAAFVELHVEQGDRLERAGLPVGIVDVVSGSTRLAMEITGRATHSGSTPMDHRSDALAAAAEIVLLAERTASDEDHAETRATVGVLNVQPGSITTIPGRATLTLDVRDVEGVRQRATAAEIVRTARDICARRQASVTSRPIGDSAPATLSPRLRQIMVDACQTLGLPYMTMPSGASHDAQMINHVVPTALMFVPSRAGLSHVPDEWTSTTDLAVGVDLLLRGLLEIDRIGGESADG